jgi:hypothetical protein
MYAQVALAGLRLLGQQVALKSLIPAYLTGTGNPERLFSAGVGLYFWHVLKFGMAKVRKKMYSIPKIRIFILANCIAQKYDKKNMASFLFFNYPSISFCYLLYSMLST